MKLHFNWKSLIACALIGACLPLCAQTHKVTKPEDVVRAVGVYEWTGDLKKPDASRLIPVSLFIDGHLQDAGVYMAKPVPFALETGTIFELDEAGIAKGTVQLSFARHLVAVGNATPYEDGWFGYGVFKTPVVPKPKPPAKVRESHAVVAVNGNSDDPDRPVLLRKSGTGDADSETNTPASASDPNRPTLKRKTDASSGDAVGPAPPEDPDRPVLKKKSAPDTETEDANTDTTSPITDPDRPTLKKRSASAARAAQDERLDAEAGGDSSLNNDPNRPTLHRGKPVANMTAEELPKLTGLPVDLHQMVAVSDAKTRTPHDFSRKWESDTERMDILGKLHAIALAKVLAYSNEATAPPAKPTPAPATLAAKRRAALQAKKAADAAAASVTFTDEDLRGYMLSYGGTPTYVYTASAGPDAKGATRYVSLVAQADGLGDLKLAMSSVTDAEHLDRTPKLRLVDVVDAEASNRASLLLELRAQHSRQFALYRVIGAQSEQIFTTGSTQ